MVNDFSRERILIKPVDGKVAALCVFFRRGKFNRIRTAPIFVRSVGPKGRDFDCFTSIFYNNNAEVFTDGI